MTWILATPRFAHTNRAQLGLFTLRQALDAGFTRAAIARRLQNRHWSEADTRVYFVAGGVDLDDRRRVRARTLATGGVASGLTAGALWDYLPFPPDIHVTVARTRRPRVGGDVHSSRQLPPVDVTLVGGIPATTAVRTLIDLGGILPIHLFEPIFDAAIFDGTVRAPCLRASAEALRHPRRPGCALVLRLLAQRAPDLVRVRSHLEASALRVCSQLGLPRPLVNHPVLVGGSRRVLDLCWPDVQVAVEVDGFAPHAATRQTFDDDRARGNALLAEGWAVFHVTATALARDPSDAFAAVASALARRRAETAP